MATEGRGFSTISPPVAACNVCLSCSLSPALKYLVLRGLWIFQWPSAFMIALVTSVPPLSTQNFPLLLYYVSFYFLLIQYMILTITHCF